jgi:hypothetical protein
MARPPGKKEGGKEQKCERLMKEGRRKKKEGKEK